jgi:hypothetical protein
MLGVALLVIAWSLALSAGTTHAQSSRSAAPGTHHMASRHCHTITKRCLCPPGQKVPKYCTLCKKGQHADPASHSCQSNRAKHACRNPVTGKAVHYRGNRLPLRCKRPPKAISDPPKHVHRHSAVIKGHIHVRSNLRTRWYFIWGQCGQLIHKTRIRVVGKKHHHFKITLHHLIPGTLYCYRIVGYNKRGKSVGKIERFRTEIAKKPKKHPHGFTG